MKGPTSGKRLRDGGRRHRRAGHERPSHLVTHRLLAASLALLGRLDEAREAIRALLALSPGGRLAHAAAATALRGRPREHYLDGLRRAGMPE